MMKNVDGRDLFAFAVLVGVVTLAASSACDRNGDEKRTGSESTSETSQDASKNSESRRIVSIGGTVTEVVYAMGAGDRVVAVDKSSLYPKETKEVRHLDLFRKVSAEAVLSYEPDLVLATEAAEPAKAFERVQQAGVTVERFESSESIEQSKGLIENVGEVLGAPERASELVESLEADLEDAREAASRCEKPAKTLFLYARGRGTTFVAGEHTSAQRMIELAGGRHIPTSIEGFKPMSPEAVLEENPQVVLMTDSGLESVGGLSGLGSVKGLSETPALEEERVVTMGDLELLGFGPRTGRVAKRLAGRLCLDDGGDREDEK